jgi:hypothetical protein
MGARSIDLGDGANAPRVQVFRALEKIVRSNPTFQRIVKPTSFRTWSGDPQDEREFGFEIAPAMRWTPTNGPDKFVTPEMQAGALFIRVEILIPGTNSDDYQNFWWMVSRCFYPGGPINSALALLLQNAGAHSGLVFFPQPAFDQQPDGVWLASAGMLHIDIRNDIYV